MQKHKRLLLFIALLTFAETVLARAGGGGAEEAVKGGILMAILAFILAPFLFIYALVVTILWRRKKWRAERLAGKLAAGDPVWDLRNMKGRVEQVFFKVQNAWMKRDQELAADCMSSRIYEKHKAQTDNMITAGTINMLENINLLSVMITSVEDFTDNSRDRFSAIVKGRMIDYHINEQTKAVVRGNPQKPENFEERWSFIREKNTWLLDEIDQQVDGEDLRYSRAYTEK